MAIDPEELEEIPPQGHVRVVYTGPVAPHWEIHRVFGDQRAIDEFRQRAMARLQLLPVYDPQFRRNRERSRAMPSASTSSSSGTSATSRSSQRVSARSGGAPQRQCKREPRSARSR